MPSRLGIQTVVYVNGIVVPSLIPLVVYRSTGGKQLDRAILMVDLGRTGQRLQNFSVLSGGYGLDIEIVEMLSTGPQVIHWGRLSITSIDLGDVEEQKITSRIEPFYFGNVLLGQVEQDPVSGMFVTNPVELTLNPEIDDIIEPNMSPAIGPSGAHFFLDPECLRTSISQAQYPGGVAELWTLSTAVEYLCITLNGGPVAIGAPSIVNPTPASLAILGTDTSLLKNHRIPNGVFLPEALDMLLEPFGFGWYVEFLGIGLRQIKFFKHGDLLGPIKQVYLQAPGNVWLNDNAADNKLDYNVGSTVNMVEVLGDWHYVESTFELVRAWNSSYDGAHPHDDLGKQSNSNYYLTPDYQRVWRDWVLNEAGDYNGLRSSITAPYDLSTLLGHVVVPRRRRFYPTITQGSDLAPIGETAGVLVEWSDGGDWKQLAELKNGTCHLLEKECGIRFDGHEPPAQLIDAGASAKVRVTATIRDDLRLSAQVPQTSQAPQFDPSPALIDCHTRFHWREVLSGSQFYTAVSTNFRPSTSVNDSQAALLLASDIQQAWDMADVNGLIVIEGLDNLQYTLGDGINLIVGRQINLNARTGFINARYPQVVGIEYDLQKQMRRLHLETFREPLTVLTGDLGIQLAGKHKVVGAYPSEEVQRQ